MMMMWKILILMLLLPLAAMKAQSVGTQQRDEAAVSSRPAMSLVPATRVSRTTAGDTIEVSERELQEALQEIARAVQLNELQQMVAEMAAQQQLPAPATERRYEERFDRLERLLAGMAGRMGYSPAATERRNLIVMPDGSTAVPYPVYPVQGDDPALIRQIELLQEQIALLEQQISGERKGDEGGEAAADNTALRLQAMRTEMQRLQQERTARSELLAVENRRADSLLQAFLAEQPLTAEGSAPARQRSAAAEASLTRPSAENIKDAERLRGTLIALYQRQLFFTVASSDLTGESVSALEEVAALLQHQPELNVLLTGYASPEGNRDYNLRLSRRRAVTAASYLRRKGIVNDRIHVNPEGVDETSDMRTYGRRVDIGVF
jgi:outer membrane protein OmpA-like peptidoglycan-associated protein